MPGMYADGDYDLAGFCVGAVERDKVLTGLQIAPGDVILGIASSGVHSNGFSLVRRIIAERGWSLDERAPLGRGPDDLVTCSSSPTRIYVRSLLPLVQQGRIKGLAHITGGGLLENIPRVLPENCHAVVDFSAWQLPPVFELLQQGGNIEPAEMARTFNCGIGMIAIVSADEADEVASALEARRKHIPHRSDRSRKARLHGERSRRPSWTATHNA